MECNKDEANRAADLSEKKFAARDLAGARKFALKAMQLYPALERAKLMLAVVEVHAAAEVKVNGETDWYGILQVEQAAEDAIIKKQYRKMALLLHPDKNRLTGAEPAFKLIGEAWGVLSDKLKRTGYDHKRSAPPAVPRTFKKSQGQGANGDGANANGHSAPKPKPKSRKRKAVTSPSTESPSATSAPPAPPTAPASSAPSAPPAAPSAPPAASSAPPAASSAPTARPAPASMSAPPPSASVSTSDPAQPVTASTSAKLTFWTQCPKCKIQYQYYREYENFQLLCHRCSLPFLAREVEVPPDKKENKSVNGENAHSAAFKQMQQKAKDREERKKDEIRRKEEREREKTQRRIEKEALKKANEERKKKEAEEKQLKKERDRLEKEARKRMMEAMKKKLKRHKDEEEDDDDDDDESDEDDDDGDEEGIIAEAHGESSKYGLRRSRRQRGNVTYNYEFDNDRNAKKARTEEVSEEDKKLLHQLEEIGRQCVLNALKVTRATLKKVVKEEEPKVAANNSNGNGFEKKNTGKVFQEQQQTCVKNREEIAPDSEAEAEAEVEAKTSEGEGEAEAEEEKEEEASDDEVYDVPDPDFHFFDGDRTEKDVLAGQVWAVYEDIDGMPRYYCEIKQVVTTDPFVVRTCWLEHHNSSKEEETWEETGLTLSSGHFKVKRKMETETNIRKFSHIMNVDRIQGGLIKVYPKKGQIWALYREWSMKWLSMNHDGRVMRYEMVEVVSDFEQEKGVSVVGLVKVNGFKTIFQRSGQGNPNSNRVILSREMLRFSHQVPAHWMMGNEKPNAPKECWELDTAATPEELINGISKENDVL